MNKKLDHVLALDGSVVQVLDLVVVQLQRGQAGQLIQHRAQSGHLVVGEIQNLKLDLGGECIRVDAVNLVVVNE